jgi:hypothetical protein
LESIYLLEGHLQNNQQECRTWEQESAAVKLPMKLAPTITSATRLCSQGGLPYQALLGLHRPGCQQAAQHTACSGCTAHYDSRAPHFKSQQESPQIQAVQQMLTNSSVRSLHLARNCSRMEPRRFAAATGPSCPGPGSTVAASAPSSSCGAWE